MPVSCRELGNGEGPQQIHVLRSSTHNLYCGSQYGTTMAETSRTVRLQALRHQEEILQMLNCNLKGFVRTLLAKVCSSNGKNLGRSDDGLMCALLSFHACRVAF